MKRPTMRQNTGFFDPKYSKKKIKLIIYPDDPAKKYWDLMILFFVIYSIIATPYIVAFSYIQYIYSYRIFELIIDLLFMTDLIINFFTAYINSEGRVITKKRV